MEANGTPYPTPGNWYAGNQQPAPSTRLPASTTASRVQHSSVLAVFASTAANDISPAKVQNLPVHSCRRMRGGRPQFGLPDTGHRQTPCPEEQCLLLPSELLLLQVALLWAFHTPAMIRCRRLSTVGCRLSLVCWPGCCSY